MLLRTYKILTCARPPYNMHIVNALKKVKELASSLICYGLFTHKGNLVSLSIPYENDFLIPLSQ